MVVVFVVDVVVVSAVVVGMMPIAGNASTQNAIDGKIAAIFVVFVVVVVVVVVVFILSL